jgi:hypothetical protein
MIDVRTLLPHTHYPMIQITEPLPPASRGWTSIEVKGPPPPIDAEFKGGEAADVFNACGLAMGRCFGSKSGYRRTHPKNLFIPNANVCAVRGGKLWWGDLDIRRDAVALERVAWRLRRRLYVLSEGDARFHEADVHGEEVIWRARWCTGGRLNPYRLKVFLRKSGLSPTQAALLLRISRQSLQRRLLPEVALELGRRMQAFDEWFSMFVKRRPRLKWGRWLWLPNRQLGGQRPIDLVRQERSHELRKLLPSPQSH